jgi:hypothetical protein
VLSVDYGQLSYLTNIDLICLSFLGKKGGKFGVAGLGAAKKIGKGKQISLIFSHFSTIPFSI